MEAVLGCRKITASDFIHQIVQPTICPSNQSTRNQSINQPTIQNTINPTSQPAIHSVTQLTNPLSSVLLTQTGVSSLTQGLVTLINQCYCWAVLFWTEHYNKTSNALKTEERFEATWLDYEWHSQTYWKGTGHKTSQGTLSFGKIIFDLMVRKRWTFLLLFE